MTTAPRAKVSASLATRGRPEMWANEQETAALSGYGYEQFRLDLARLEAAGFPKASPWNGKRFIPHVIAFWENPPDSEKTGTIPDHTDEAGLENWDDDAAAKPRKRITA